MVLDIKVFSLGLILGTFAISIAPALSSNPLQCTFGLAFSILMPCCPASCEVIAVDPWRLIKPSGSQDKSIRARNSL